MLKLHFHQNVSLNYCASDTTPESQRIKRKRVSNMTQTYLRFNMRLICILLTEELMFTSASSASLHFDPKP